MKPARRFHRALQQAIRDPTLAPQLQSAADGARLKPWTELLTHAVVQACLAIGWVCAAKGAGVSPFPVRPGEYLGIDVLAFPPGDGWRRAVAAIELENSQRLPIIAYAAWKACSVRADFSCLMCYRGGLDQVATLVDRLTNEVFRPVAPTSPVMVVVGTRGTAATFPDGYFRTFHWDRAARSLRSGVGG